jgi:fumarylacetoacetate (FAA) hydrolase family protein
MTKIMLPIDHEKANLIGRIWLPNEDPSLSGPAIVTIRDSYVYDLTHYYPTCSQLLASDDPLSIVREGASKSAICSVEELVENSFWSCSSIEKVHLLSPIDLQCIKAAGVTFTNSLMERIIEERAGGDAGKTRAIRAELLESLDVDLSSIKPGSAEAKRVEQQLRSQGLWSQYLEVGIGEYAEIFTKSPVLSSVGYGQLIGVHPESVWNNPEAEVVLVMNTLAEPVGAMLGNDVNLRDFEGRSALLLARGKDNNASCALGPFIRLFDDTFTLDTVRQLSIRLTVEGEDGYSLCGESTMNGISRDILDLVNQTANETHQYPDGFVLMTGTQFAPTQDRGGAGKGFTHHLNDVVTISSKELGTLVNCVTTSDKAPPWSFGIQALISSLKNKGLL